MKKIKILLLTALCSTFLFATDNNDMLNKIMSNLQSQASSSDSKLDFSQFDKEISSFLNKLKDSKNPAEEASIEEQAKKYYDNYIKGMSKEDKEALMNNLKKIISENQDEIKKLIMDNQDAIKNLSPKLKNNLKALEL